MTEQRVCKICGKPFIATHHMVTACSEECKRQAARENDRRRKRKNVARRAAQKKERAERKRYEESRRSDTIVAIGYAERQMADSLMKAGRVRTEL